MKIRNLLIVFRKEMLDIVRDRRTLVFMTILPIVLVPVMLWTMSSFIEMGVKKLRDDTATIAVINSQQAPSLIQLIQRLENAKDDPSQIAKLKDPLLVGAMLQMATPEELQELQLVAEATGTKIADRLGGARFLNAVEFEPTTLACKRLFDDDPTDLLSNGDRLKLMASALQLRESGEELGARIEVEHDPSQLRDQSSLIADRERLARMSPQELETLDEQLVQLEILREELSLAIEAKRYDAVLILHQRFGEALYDNGTARYSVLFDESLDRSRAARRKLVGFLDRLGTGVARLRMVDQGMTSAILRPFQANEVNLGRERSPIIDMLPYFMILMCLLGALYPATDLGAGEKERGTLETLLVTPAGRVELVLGKFLVVTLAAVIAALLNVVSLTISVQMGLLDLMGGGLTLDGKAILISVLLMLPVAALFAAVLLAVSIFAKSFKEAQSYAAPIQFVVIIPALVSMMPGVELTMLLSVVPLVNVSLALKEAWLGIFHWDYMLVIFLSSMVYASVALAFCVTWFQREDVLFRT